MNKLPINEFVGYDGKTYRDLGVDSVSRCVTLWLRRRLKDGTYHIVAAIVKGRVFSTQVNEEEAKTLYFELPDKVEYKDAFDDKEPKTKKS